MIEKQQGVRQKEKLRLPAIEKSVKVRPMRCFYSFAFAATVSSHGFSKSLACRLLGGLLLLRLARA
ncbi:MAG: hypothetical protein LBP90_05740 [Burkholderiales bacterium]|nr:hypothetical protein [Burkholderiales bacterium]